MIRIALFLAVFTAIMIGMDDTYARQKVTFSSSGTGFFVSPYGYLITNEHVIRQCQRGSDITLEGAINGTAKVIDTDAKHDLALLRADSNAPASGKLLNAERYIGEGDQVMVMGYPRGGDERGNYTVEMSEVVGTQGPTGEPHWIQFQDTVQKGNSGGPLLDRSGNVIGVVVGKTTLTRTDHNGRVQDVTTSDIAVSLPILKRFLDKNRIRYNQGTTQVIRSDRYVEQTARSFILKVKCVTGEGYAK